MFGDVNPIIGSITALLLVAVVVSLLAWMRRITANQGAKSAYDWDDYSSEFDDDEDDYEHESAPVQETAAAATVDATSTSEEAETDWIMGSDGYWWYHDKETNEWWYKDANGDIVKHP